MKKSLLVLALATLVSSPALVQADGVYQESAPARRSRPARVSAAEPLPPPPTCSSHSPSRKIELVSFNPNQPAGKIVGSIQECVSTMYDVLKLLSGPNTIGLKYPEEREQWGYYWLWSYKLQNPIEDSIILMDKPGKRIMKGKDPVELYITFNEHDVVESVEMDLIKKKNSQQVLFP
jgi:hypothetical protein